MCNRYLTKSGCLKVKLTSEDGGCEGRLIDLPSQPGSQRWKAPSMWTPRTILWTKCSCRIRPSVPGAAPSPTEHRKVGRERVTRPITEGKRLYVKRSRGRTRSCESLGRSSNRRIPCCRGHRGHHGQLRGCLMHLQHHLAGAQCLATELHYSKLHNIHDYVRIRPLRWTNVGCNNPKGSKLLDTYGNGDSASVLFPRGVYVQRLSKEHYGDAGKSPEYANVLNGTLEFEHVWGTTFSSLGCRHQHHVDKGDQHRRCASRSSCKFWKVIRCEGNRPGTSLLGLVLIGKRDLTSIVSCVYAPLEHNKENHVEE